MMKNFRDYLEESKRVYRFRIKTVVPIHDGMMDRIEDTLKAYDAVMISRPKTTILHTHPLDFPNVSAGEVTIIDVETALPASSYEMMMNLRSALNIPEPYIVVRGEYEPQERYTRQINDREELMAQHPTAPLLSTESSSAENDLPIPTLYGDAYNMSLLRYLTARGEEKPEGADENDQTVRPIPKWEKPGDAPAKTSRCGVVDPLPTYIPIAGNTVAVK